MRHYPEWFMLPEVGNAQAERVYRQSHSSRPSFLRVLGEVNTLADCTSIMDVGSGPLGMLEKVGPQYRAKIEVDPCKPAERAAGTGIDFHHCCFLSSGLRPHCDVVVCMETLEHVRPDLRRAFAQKLLASTRRRLFVTIPYEWKGCPEPIPHDGYNESNVMEWFWPVAPDVQEVISGHLFLRFDK